MKTKPLISKFRKILYTFIFVFLLAAAGILAIPENAYAASQYKQLDTIDSEPSKVGSYYLKYEKRNEQDGMIVYISKTKEGGYKATPISSYGCWYNNSQIFYIRNTRSGSDLDISLYKYVFRTGQESHVQSLSIKDQNVNFVADSWNIRSIYNGKIYLEGSINTETENATSIYAYDIQQKTLSKKLLNNCSVINANGKYMLTINPDDYSISDGYGYAPITISLYQATPNGLKKIKTLTENGRPESVMFVDNLLYYANYFYNADYSSNELILYQCKQNGTNQKELGTFQNARALWRGWDERDTVTKKYCIIEFGGYQYKYIYKTKELKKIGPVPVRDYY